MGLLPPGNVVGQYAIAAVIIAAVVALVYVALNYFGIGIPPWVVTVFWILVVAFVVIGAIKLLMSWGSTP